MPRSSDTSAVRVAPWQHLTTAEMGRVFRAEHARLAAVLAWDTSATWTALERTRVAGGVTGLVARDAAGAVAGWTYAVEHGEELQVGGFTATAAARDPLLDALLALPAARNAARVRLFGAVSAPELCAALEHRGFVTGGYDYLRSALSPADAATDTVGEGWRHGDLSAASRLLRAAYPVHDPLRPFGATPALEDWLGYVVALTSTAGCGVFAPDLSVVVRGADGALDAAALVTRLSPTVAHLAQLAVVPAARGRGLGRRVLDAARRTATAAGCGAMTLLVAADNAQARRLYDGCGFRYAASFVSAVATSASAVATTAASARQTAGAA